MKKSNYGFIETIKNIIFVGVSKIAFPGARMIRFPIVVRGKKYIDFGKNLTTGYRCRFEVNGKHDSGQKKITFGHNVNIGDNVRISATTGIMIGDNVLMGSNVLIIDNSHGKYSGEYQDSPDTPPNERKIVGEKTIIDSNVWIGENTSILAGVHIGRGSIIGANSVVTKNIVGNCVAVGSPARMIKIWNEAARKWEHVKS